MFSEDVGVDPIVPPDIGVVTKTDARGTRLTYALHTKIEWEALDSNGQYEQTWEVVRPGMMDGEAWMEFVAANSARRTAGVWSVADVPFERRPRLGTRVPAPAPAI